MSGVLTWEKVSSRLLQEYEEQSWQSNGRSGRPLKYGHALQVDKYRRPVFRSKSQRFDLSRIRRYECNAMGHFARNCHQKGKKRSNDGRATFGQGGYARQAHVLMAKGYHLSKYHNQLSFLVDSGASDNMTNNVTLLSRCKDILLRSIILGNGISVKAYKQGNMTVSSTVENDGVSETVQLDLKRVLFVPNLEENLISCSSLCNDGFNISFQKGKCIVSKHGETALEAQRRDGLYQAKGEIYEQRSAYTSVSQKGSSRIVPQWVKTWHNRLGHAHIESIAKLQNTDAVVGRHIAHGSKDKAPCDSCIAGNFTRKLSRFNPMGAQNIGDCIHSDVCGPMSVNSLGGGRYFVTFIDEHSDYVSVRFIEKKSEVATVIKPFRVWFECCFDCTVKKLHSDRGGEYICLKRYLQDHGIEWTCSPPYSPNQMVFLNVPIVHWWKLHWL